MWEESDYYKSLNNEDQINYKKKLTLKSGLLPDPYIFTNWQDDVRLLPDIGMADIYLYLIETPSLFTHEKLKCYKSLDAYNFFLCGHVQDVFYHEISKENEYCYIKSEVLLLFLKY